MAEQNTYYPAERFDIEVVYNCGSCKYEKTSLIKEPCMSCHIDHKRADRKPTRYEPKSCDCEACQIHI